MTTDYYTCLHINPVSIIFVTFNRSHFEHKLTISHVVASLGCVKQDWQSQLTQEESIMTGRLWGGDGIRVSVTNWVTFIAEGRQRSTSKNVSCSRFLMMQKKRNCPLSQSLSNFHFVEMCHYVLGLKFFAHALYFTLLKANIFLRQTIIFLNWLSFSHQPDLFTRTLFCEFKNVIFGQFYDLTHAYQAFNLLCL